MRRKTTKTGVSLFAFLLLSLPLAGLAWQKPEPAVIAGTVFRDPGFALSGAEVEVQPLGPATGRKQQKPLRARTDSRGEFAFQVPPEPAEYRVTARARGYASEERIVKLSGGAERVDVYLTLKPAARTEK